LQELQIINKKDPWPKGWGQKTSIMGVINLTPDSFSDGGELNSSKKVLDQVNHFLCNGVDVIDLGAQSTRPGAKEVGSSIEIKRLIPYLKLIKSEFPDVIISIEKDLMPNRLCNYVFELCQTFNRFYDQVPILKEEKNIKISRLNLCDLTAKTLKLSLELLGIETLERM